MTKNASQM